jgi:transposase
VQKSTTIAVDLAKNVFQVAVSENPGKVSESHRLSRAQFLAFFAQRPPSQVVLEACGSAHFWARELKQLGHQVRLLPPDQVRAYVPRNKTDAADARALLEAHRNERIRTVPVKTVEQQVLASLHRMRSSWMKERTAKGNVVRGLLRELGLTIPVGANQVVPHVRAWLAQEPSPVPEALRWALEEACQQIDDLAKRIHGIEVQLRALARQMPLVSRLLTIPGVGLLTATALVGLVGDMHRFATCRHFASFLGLTPRESSSGPRRWLGRISKAGDVYLRTLLVHGARSALVAAKRYREPDALRAWGLRIAAKNGFNKATVAMANKMARIVWAVWRRETPYTAGPVVP